MSHHRGTPVWLIPLSCLVATTALAQEAPEKALKFHEALPAEEVSETQKVRQVDLAKTLDPTPEP